MLDWSSIFLIVRVEIRSFSNFFTSASFSEWMSAASLPAGQSTMPWLFRSVILDFFAWSESRDVDEGSEAGRELEADTLATKGAEEELGNTYSHSWIVASS